MSHTFVEFSEGVEEKAGWLLNINREFRVLIFLYIITKIISKKSHKRNNVAIFKMLLECSINISVQEIYNFLFLCRANLLIITF